MTKQEQANEIYRDELGKENTISIRQRVIARIQKELGMSAAGASTYCANAKKNVEGGKSTTVKEKGPKVKAASEVPLKPFVPKPMPEDINVLYSAVRVDKQGLAVEVSSWRDRECAELEAEQKKWHFVIGLQQIGEKPGVVDKGSKPAGVKK